MDPNAIVLNTSQSKRILDEAVGFRDEVLSRYAAMGLHLARTPQVHYVEQRVLHSQGETLGTAKVRFATARAILRAKLQLVWEHHFCVNLGSQALDELTDLEIAVFSSFESDSVGQTGDFILHGGYAMQSQEGRKETVAHEIMHLIEDELGYLEEHPIIGEGTATYAERRVFGKKLLPQKVRKHTVTSILYTQAARVVQDRVDTSANPLLLLTRGSVREEIDTQFKRHLGRALANAFIRDRIKVDNASVYKRAHASREGFKKLGPSIDSRVIAQAYEINGAPNLAQELRSSGPESLRAVTQYWRNIWRVPLTQKEAA